MSRLQKEMKVLFRNNLEKHRLERTLADLNEQQIKEHERCTNYIRIVHQELLRFHQSSGRSNFGVACSEREATGLMIESEIPKSAIKLPKASITGIKVSWSAEPVNYQRRNTMAGGELTRLVSTVHPGGRKAAPRSFRQLSYRETQPLLDITPPTKSAQPITNKLARMSSVTASLENQSKRNIKIMQEQERLSVRRHTLAIQPEENLTGEINNSNYIKPQDRYKYDVFVTKRMTSLKRVFPAESTSGQSPLRSAFSATSRKSSLCQLVEINNRKIKKSREAKPDVHLQMRLEQFLKHGGRTKIVSVANV